MGKRGPQPKPTKLRLIEGNPGNQKINKSEPQPEAQVPACPIQLKGMARTEWKRVSKILLRNGLISLLDRAALAAYCSSYARFIYWEGKLLNDPDKAIQHSSKTGYDQVAPALTIRSQALKEMNTYLSKFGMSPSDRVGLVGQLDPDKRSLSQRVADRRKKK